MVKSRPCAHRVFTKLAAALERQRCESEELSGTASKRWKLTSSEEGLHQGSGGQFTLHLLQMTLWAGGCITYCFQVGQSKECACLVLF